MTIGAPRSIWDRLPRGARRIAGLAVSVYLGWLFVVNLALWSDLPAWAVTGERPRSTVQLEYGWAWCVWPTRIHVSDFHLAVDTWKWQMDLQVPAGEVDVAVWALVNREFRAREIEVDGADVVFRSKLEESEDDLDRLRAFGPMPEGFPHAVRRRSPPEDPPFDEAWRIQLASVTGRLDRLWLNELRAELDAEIVGSLDVLTNYAFALEPTRLDVRNGTFWIGPQRVLENLQGRLDIDVSDYNTNALEGRPVLRQVSVLLDATARSTGLAWTEAFLDNAPLTPTGGGAGPIEVDAVFGSGVLQPGSFIRYRTEALEVRAHAMTWQAAAEVVAEVTPHAQGLRTEVSVDASDLAVYVAATRIPWMTARSFEAFVAFGSADLAEPWSLVETRLSMPPFAASTRPEQPASREGRPEQGKVRIDRDARKRSVREPDGRLSQPWAQFSAFFDAVAVTQVWRDVVGGAFPDC